MKKEEVAELFSNIADFLEIKGENRFRIRAYRDAAETISNCPQDLEYLMQQKKLTNLKGIGKDLASKIEQALRSNKIDFLEELKKELPASLLELTKIPGLGPKTIKVLFKQLKITDVDSLEKAAEQGRLSQLPGIKAKTEKNILEGITLLRQNRQGMPYLEAKALAEAFINDLSAKVKIKSIDLAGSLRRKKETVNDIDILLSCQKPQEAVRVFTSHPLVNRVLLKGSSKISVLAGDNNMQIDLRLTDRQSSGAALIYFTGSKSFNVELRKVAIKNNYKINEYGLIANNKIIASKSEKAIFDKLKMQEIPPELRENRGEIKAAIEGKLPKLITVEDIKGDLHLHSNYSDGHCSLLEIAHQAQKLNYQYLAITDHSQSLKVANGLEPKRVREKIEKIKELNAGLKDLTILCGAEVDILSDGELDYPQDILRELDVVVAAIHSGFKQTKKQLTNRVIKAIKNKYTNIVAHPTGRLKGVRRAYELDLEEVFRAAKDNKVALEINCYAQRLDLDENDSLAAKKQGVKLSIGSDAHDLKQLTMMGLGVNSARRGWIEAGDVINCLPKEQLLKWLKK
jgi:DNA polymerase (family 10)